MILSQNTGGKKIHVSKGKASKDAITDNNEKHIKKILICKYVHM
jgi:hypothetical protein